MARWQFVQFGKMSKTTLIGIFLALSLIVVTVLLGCEKWKVSRLTSVKDVPSCSIVKTFIIIVGAVGRCCGIVCT